MATNQKTLQERFGRVTDWQLKIEYAGDRKCISKESARSVEDTITLTDHVSIKGDFRLFRSCEDIESESNQGFQWQGDPNRGTVTLDISNAVESETVYSDEPSLNFEDEYILKSNETTPFAHISAKIDTNECIVEVGKIPFNYHFEIHNGDEIIDAGEEKTALLEMSLKSNLPKSGFDIGNELKSTNLRDPIYYPYNFDSMCKYGGIVEGSEKLSWTLKPITTDVEGKILTTEDIGRWNSKQNIQDLARVVMSEASVGNQAEQSAVAYTILNRMKRNKKNQVQDVWGKYAHNQSPSQKILDFSRDILSCKIADNSAGATHFYSPKQMPPEGKCPKKDFPHCSYKGVTYDVSGGVEHIPGHIGNYRPGFANDSRYDYVDIAKARDWYYKFYRPLGERPVN